jgi:hypothetical protein
MKSTSLRLTQETTIWRALLGFNADGLCAYCTHIKSICSPIRIRLRGVFGQYQLIVKSVI